MKESVHNYTDIIDLPHHVSTKHPPMARDKRAAQFAPFAALTGYEEAVEEMKEKVIRLFEELNSNEKDDF